MTQLAISIVTYHSSSTHLHQLLLSLFDSLSSANAEFPIHSTLYLVINDEEQESSNEAAQTVASAFESAPSNLELVILKGHGNVGYGAGHNLVFENYESDYYLILNPDVVVDKAAINVALQYHRLNGDVAMIVPQGYDTGTNYARLAKREPNLLVLLCRALGVVQSNGYFGRLVGEYVYADRLPSSSPVEVDCASGCFMFLPSETVRFAKGFDERFFLYFEDYDLSKRVSEFGRIVEVPGVRIVHHGGHTSRRGVRRISHFVRSAFLFFSRYGWKIT